MKKISKQHLVNYVPIGIISLLVLSIVFGFSSSDKHLKNIQGTILCTSYANQLILKADFPNGSKHRSNDCISDISKNPDNDHIYLGALNANVMKSVCELKYDTQSQEFMITNRLYSDIYEGDEGEIYAPKYIPNTSKISFKQNGSYWILDVTTGNKTKLDITNAYSLAWLNDHTALYTKLDFPYLSGVSILQYDILSGEETIYKENAYGCSVSANGEYLSYGVADTDIIETRTLSSGECRSIQAPASTLFNRKAYSLIFLPDRNEIQTRSTLDQIDIQLDHLDVIQFTPSPDGQYLLFSHLYADKKERSDAKTVIINIATDQQIRIDQGTYMSSLSWSSK